MISCKDYVEIKKKLLKDRIETFNRKPKLCVIQIGNNPASNAYVRGKAKDCEEIGITFNHLHIENYEEVSQVVLMEMIELIDADPTTDGIIIQLPIPDKYDIEELQKCISPDKDVDGFRKDSYFDPCTPKGVIDWLKYNNYEFKGKTACVIGRSDIVGKPLARMLSNLDSTVILCHSKTPVDKLTYLISDSDIVFTCINQIEYFDYHDFYSWQDIIDIGLGRGVDGKLHGNITGNHVDYLKERNYGHFIVSGTGSVGLITRVKLLENVIEAYELKMDVTINNTENKLEI